MKVMVINGVNLNMLGIREKDLYGARDFATLKAFIKEAAEELDIEVELYQSNHEGDIVDKIQACYFDDVDGIVINAGAYTHTSIAILDALKAVSIPTVEVHITDISSREDFRKISYISLYAEKMIKGKGFDGYKEALIYLKGKYGK